VDGTLLNAEFQNTAIEKLIPDPIRNTDSLLVPSLSLYYFPPLVFTKIFLFKFDSVSGVSVLANREVMQALTTLAHFNNMTNGSLFGTAFGQVGNQGWQSSVFFYPIQWGFSGFIGFLVLLNPFFAFICNF
jgi:hypothetical protein